MSIFGGFEDEVYDVELLDGGYESGDGDHVDVDLREEGVSAQRLVVSRMTSRFVHGRAHVSVVDPRRRITGEKLFNLPGLLSWEGGHPTAIIEALASNRTRARLEANMGTGKTTGLAPIIARELDYRVLLVSLDAHCLQQVGVYVAGKGTGRFRRNFPTKPGAAICAMTYGDFNGYMVGGERARVYSSFDLIIFDEAFVDEAEVFAAKRNFAAYANDKINLLLASATISAEKQGEGAGASSLGAFRELTESMSVEEAIKSGKLVTTYLTDRVGVAVPLDSQVKALAAHYEEYGADVRSLDSASSYDDLSEVCAWLRGDSTAPRVVVMHARYWIAFNVPIAFSIIWAQRAVLRVDGNQVREEVVPLCEPMVTQFKSRTGRGLVPGSGGVVMTAERAPIAELHDSEKHRAFVLLCAASIRPLRTAFWEESYELFGGKMPSASLAAQILKIGLPVEVALRYFASDGRVARKYASAVNAFAQPDHFLLPSDDELPMSYEHWVVEGWNGQGEVGGVRHVPVAAVGELGTVLHTISAMAEGEFSINRWRPSRFMAFGDGYDSDEEQRNSRFAGVPRLRRVQERVEPEPPKQIAPPHKWSYQPTAERFEEIRRGGRFIDTTRFQEALAALDASLQEYQVPDTSHVMPPSPDEPGVAEIELPALGAVESPGGSLVCQISTDVCHKMNEGVVMDARETLEVVVAAKPVVARFVASRLFDAFSGPWESYLLSLCDSNVVHELVRRGMATDAYAIVDKMRGRFNLELISVLSKSNVLRKRFKRLFTRAPSANSVMRAIHAGKFDNVAQTSRFFERIKTLKGLIDLALIRAEEWNVYLPGYITEAQRVAYVGPSVVGAVGHGLHRQIEGMTLRDERAAQDQRLIDRFNRPLRQF